MNIEDYKSRFKALKQKHVKEIDTLHTEYALANNPYNVGDVFTDHIGSIRVESISVNISLTWLPTCVYTGLVLKKDGTPTKKLEKRQAWQTNEVK